MDIIVVGEDEVTREIIKRILFFTNKNFNITREDPIRGGQIKSKISNYNKLATLTPVVLLTDMDDSDCPISLKENWFKGEEVHPNFIFRVAYNEAESWLMSDRAGMSDFLKIPIEKMPETFRVDRKNIENIELRFPYKPSLFLIKDLIQHSSSELLKDQLKPRNLAKKGPEYNSTLVPFIRNQWNINEAIKNSYSLKKAILRIRNFAK